MSHDPWGGGSDLDPKLRLKELGTYREPNPGNMQQRPRSFYVRQKPRFSLFDGILLLIAIVAALAVYASLSS